MDSSRALQHSNLLQCLAQCAEVTPYLLVMEFCPLVSGPLGEAAVSLQVLFCSSLFQRGVGGPSELVLLLLCLLGLLLFLKWSSGSPCSPSEEVCLERVSQQQQQGQHCGVLGSSAGGSGTVAVTALTAPGAEPEFWVFVLPLGPLDSDRRSPCQNRDTGFAETAVNTRAAS